MSAPAATLLSGQRRPLPARAAPPTSELFTKFQLAQRHPHLLNDSRLTWALRNRSTNGLASAVFESRSGELLLHEPQFLAWYLGLSGLSKPRALRRRKPRKVP